MTRRVLRAPASAMVSALAAVLALPAGLASGYPATARDAAAGGAATDYDRDLAAIDRELAAAGPDERLYWLHARASLTGGFEDFGRLEREIERALAAPTLDQAAGPSSDPPARPPDELLVYRATLHLELHRLAAARADLDRLTHRDGWPYLRLLGADLALQEGRYEEARRAFEELLAEERTWDRMARVAHLAWRTGDAERADALYREAQDGLTAKEMRTFAWLELQRGEIDLEGGLEGGRADEALAHFRRAVRAYSGWWLAEEHLAEALAAAGRPREAAALYRRLGERTGDPEHLAALARLVARRDPAEAAALLRRADALFAERLARFPEAAIGHYVEHLVLREPADQRLLELAEENHRLRPNAESKLLLAEACLRLGDRARARALLAEIAATPWRSRELDRLRARLAS